MIDVVIPLGRGSEYNHELRYSLRGIEKYLSNYRNIIVVGECPSFLKNVIHIPMQDLSNKQHNIMLKVLAACNDERVSDKFLFWNDDFFLLKPVDAVNYPYYHNGYLYNQMLKRSPNDYYTMSMANTYNALNNPSSMHFDIHCPIVYDKAAVKQIMGKYDWTIRHGYIVKSLYANNLGIEGEKMGDCKIDKPFQPEEILKTIEGRHIFSVGNRGTTSNLYKVLQSLYISKSKYE